MFWVSVWGDLSSFQPLKVYSSLLQLMAMDKMPESKTQFEKLVLLIHRPREIRRKKVWEMRLFALDESELSFAKVETAFATRVPPQ